MSVVHILGTATGSTLHRVPVFPGEPHGHPCDGAGREAADTLLHLADLLGIIGG